jgi:hypothetical protein
MTEQRKPPPLPADEEALIEAWLGPESTAVIAGNLGIKGSELDSAWRRLKREGKLPRHSRQGARGRIEPLASTERPAADEDGSAALLEALIQVHGDDNETGERADLYPGSHKRRR